jgi:hypothetical protein
MPKDLPEFDRDDELIEWFEKTDLSQYQLDEVLGWTVAERVTLAIEEPWGSDDDPPSSGGATASIELDDSLLSPA